MNKLLTSLFFCITLCLALESKAGLVQNTSLVFGKRISANCCNKGSNYCLIAETIKLNANPVVIMPDNTNAKKNQPKINNNFNQSANITGTKENQKLGSLFETNTSQGINGNFDSYGLDFNFSLNSDIFSNSEFSNANLIKNSMTRLYNLNNYSVSNYGNYANTVNPLNINQSYPLNYSSNQNLTNTYDTFDLNSYNGFSNTNLSPTNSLNNFADTNTPVNVNIINNNAKKILVK